MKIQYNIGKQIKKYRILLNMSQYELAKRTGLQPSAISHFEVNRREPCLENLIKLSIAFGISIDMLVGKIIYNGER